MEIHLRAARLTLPDEITQCYLHLPPDTSEHTPPEFQPDRLVLDLPTSEGWKLLDIYQFVSTLRFCILSCPWSFRWFFEAALVNLVQYFTIENGRDLQFSARA